MVTKTKARQKKPVRTKQVPKVIAFDLGGTKLASAVVDLNGKILAEMREPVEFTGGAKGFVKFLMRRAKYWQERHHNVKALGIASCGPLDPVGGVLMQPTNFPKWGNVPLKKPLSQALRLPVVVQNDAASAALAEGAFGAAKKLNNWIVLTLGTGLGTGIVINREIFLGGSGMGPEAGHMIVTDKPYICGCGNFGCAEAVLSGSALNRRIRERDLPYESSMELVEAARAGNPQALELFEEYANVMARTIHNLCIMYKPEKIFFSGGVSAAEDLFMTKAQLKVSGLLKERPGFEPKLAISQLKNSLGILGGAYIALKELKLLS